MQESPEPSERRRYPFLDTMLGAWFHQDFDIVGDTLEEIIGDFKKFSTQRDIAGAREDIHRFLQDFGETDTPFAELFVSVFSPGVIVEGWEGMTTKQWLLKIDSLLN